MKTYAFYRLPYKEKYISVSSEEDAEVIDSLHDIGEKRGFIISPFCKSSEYPVLLIHPDTVCEKALTADGENHGREEDCRETAEDVSSPNVSESYRESFDAFHAKVCGKVFRKLVLSRTKEIETCNEEDGKRMFLNACRTFPRLMVMLFHTPQSGTWLIASPEILIEREGETWHTVALAGTMAYREGYAEWSSKNKEEQHIVEEYISEKIAPFADNIVTDGPITMRAGNLVHLRTDFRFQIQHTETAERSLGAILENLHPTPAICGIPKREAQEFIQNTEPHCREYYSGFAGPLNLFGATHLFVSLRCCRILGDRIRLYAGGGIMPDSCCEAEWMETEQKMKTISCIATKKT